MLRADVLAQGFELVFGAVRGEIRDLRLEAARVRRGGVDDVAAELEDGVGLAFQFARKALGVGVQPHLQQRLAGAPGVFEFLQECHGEVSAV
ncbi:Uncharacterised protein [Bordetella pertussis]|nr:Uncharacterised protein [Bordetella pertussis]